MKTELGLFLAALLLLTVPAFAQEADPAELPRLPPTEPDAAAATLEVRPGFRVELAAAEPLVSDPVAAAFDPAGRLFVVEMRGYSERRESALGRVRLLVDEDDDGVFDRATTYCDGLRWPTGVVCYDGGIFVLASPDLWLFKDADGDGVAEIADPVFTGFGEGRRELNVQALPNSLRWGPDNRIWGATASNGGLVRRSNLKGAPTTNLNRADFSFDPKERTLRAEHGTAQFGLDFDSRGRRFVCANSNHLQWVAHERGEFPTSPWITPPPPLVGIAADGPAAPVFRISPDEPWRIVRTRWRVGGVVKGIVEGGGRVSGYFTGASGLTIYSGDAYGDGFRDNAFVGDVGSNLVHRKILRDVLGQLQPRGERPGDETGTEFLRSRDNWFRPVAFTNAPDGCLYVLDFYREVIEHPKSLPPGIKKHLDLNAGNDRGRIWRVVPDDPTFRRRPAPDLAAANADALAALLDHPNGWHRVTARRLLWERGDPRAAAPDKVARTEEEKDFVQALALSGAEGEEKIEALAQLARRGGEDRWRRAAVLAAIRTPAEAADLFAATADAGGTFAAELAGLIGRTGDDAAARVVVDHLAAAPGERATWQLLLVLGAGRKEAGSSLVAADPDGRLGAVFAAAAEAAAGGDGPAIAVVSRDPDPGATDGLLAAAREAARPIALIRALAPRLPAPDLAALVAGRWEELGISDRPEAVRLVLGTPAGAIVWLRRVAIGELPADSVPAADRARLRGSKDPDLRRLAEELFPAVAADRAAVVRRYRPALDKDGDPARGAAVFAVACASCHRSGGKGIALGPDREAFQAAGKEALLQHILDPNAEVAPQFVAYALKLRNGEELAGLIASETPTALTLRLPGGVERTFPRSEVASMAGLGTSLMPEGLEATITEEAMADLLAFLVE